MMLGTALLVLSAISIAPTLGIFLIKSHRQSLVSSSNVKISDLVKDEFPTIRRFPAVNCISGFICCYFDDYFFTRNFHG